MDPEQLYIENINKMNGVVNKSLKISEEKKNLWHNIIYKCFFSLVHHKVSQLDKTIFSSWASLGIHLVSPVLLAVYRTHNVLQPEESSIQSWFLWQIVVENQKCCIWVERTGRFEKTDRCFCLLLQFYIAVDLAGEDLLCWRAIIAVIALIYFNECACQQQKMRGETALALVPNCWGPAQFFPLNSFPQRLPHPQKKRAIRFVCNIEFRQNTQYITYNETIF